MGDTNSKISGYIRRELSSVKVMILAIMISFGVILSVIQFLANVVYTYEILDYIKEFMTIPYDADNNRMISAATILIWVLQLIMFLAQYIPLLFMAYGIYTIYGDAKYSGETKGLKVVGGVMHFHAVVAYIYIGLMVMVALVCIVGAFGFGNKIPEYIGVEPSEYAPVLKILAIVVVICVVMVSIVYGAIASIYMSLKGNMKTMINIQKGKDIEKMSLFGILIMLVVGANNLLSVFSGVSGSGYSTADIEMLEEMLGGSAAAFIVNMMPSANTQFRVAVIGCACAFFIGAAQLLGGIVLLGIRKNVNRFMEEQECNSYGGENFTGSN